MTTSKEIKEKLMYQQSYSNVETFNPAFTSVNTLSGDGSDYTQLTTANSIRSLISNTKSPVIKSFIKRLFDKHHTNVAKINDELEALVSTYKKFNINSSTKNNVRDQVLATIERLMVTDAKVLVQVTKLVDAIKTNCGLPMDFFLTRPTYLYDGQIRRADDLREAVWAALTHFVVSSAENNEQAESEAVAIVARRFKVPSHAKVNSYAQAHLSAAKSRDFDPMTTTDVFDIVQSTRSDIFSFGILRARSSFLEDDFENYHHCEQMGLHNNGSFTPSLDFGNGGFEHSSSTTDIGCTFDDSFSSTSYSSFDDSSSFSDF